MMTMTTEPERKGGPPTRLLRVPTRLLRVLWVLSLVLLVSMCYQQKLLHDDRQNNSSKQSLFLTGSWDDHDHLQRAATENHVDDNQFYSELDQLFPSPLTVDTPIVVVVTEAEEEIELGLNSYMSFEKHLPEAYYASIATSTKIVDKYRKDHGLPSIVMSGMEQINKQGSCPKLHTIVNLLKRGHSVMILATDIVVTAKFNMSYFSELEADLVFPADQKIVQAKEGPEVTTSFTPKIGLDFLFVLSNKSTIRFFESTDQVCRKVVSLNDGTALNEALQHRFIIDTSRLSQIEPDNVGRCIWFQFSVMF